MHIQNIWNITAEGLENNKIEIRYEVGSLIYRAVVDNDKLDEALVRLVFHQHDIRRQIDNARLN